MNGTIQNEIIRGFQEELSDGTVEIYPDPGDELSETLILRWTSGGPAQNFAKIHRKIFNRDLTTMKTSPCDFGADIAREVRREFRRCIGAPG